MEQPISLIKNHDMLREDCHVDEDLLKFDQYIERISNKLDSIQQSGILGLVGGYGVGKSTLLHLVKQKRLNENERWFEFDAWKYPDRRELWEGFVLDIACELSPKQFKQARNAILGSKFNFRRFLISVFGDIPVPGFAAIKSLNHFFQTTPARRVFEIQEIFADTIKQENKDIYVVVEDSDRSGEAGIFFLETLNQFIKAKLPDKRFIAIAPIATCNYHNNIDSYIKCIDYFEFFTPTVATIPKFLDNVLSFRDFGSFTQLILDLIQNHNNLNTRLLKLIIRNADIRYHNMQLCGYNQADPRIVLAIEASRYFEFRPNSMNRDYKVIYYNYFKTEKKIPKETMFAKMLNSVSETHSANSIPDFKIDRYSDKTIPMLEVKRGENGFLADVYLEF